MGWSSPTRPRIVTCAVGVLVVNGRLLPVRAAGLGAATRSHWPRRALLHGPRILGEPVVIVGEHLAQEREVIG
jgi:hypothetical protein